VKTLSRWPSNCNLDQHAGLDRLEFELLPFPHDVHADQSVGAIELVHELGFIKFGTPGNHRLFGRGFSRVKQAHANAVNVTIREPANSAYRIFTNVNFRMRVVMAKQRRKRSGKAGVVSAGVQKHVGPETFAREQALDARYDDGFSAEAGIAEGHASEDPGRFFARLLEDDRRFAILQVGHFLAQLFEAGAPGDDFEAAHIHHHGRVRMTLHRLIYLLNQLLVIIHAHRSSFSHTTIHTLKSIRIRQFLVDFLNNRLPEYCTNTRIGKRF
jgi:hypothetical protein